MHELSIAEAILDIVLEHAGGKRVSAVELRVGHLRQVVPDALAFAFQLLAEGTAAGGAELLLEEVPVEACCRECGVRSKLPGLPLRCRTCGGLDLEMVHGEELLVDAIEVTDEEPELEVVG